MNTVSYGPHFGAACENDGQTKMIKRYTNWCAFTHQHALEESTGGPYVLFDDHTAALAAKDAEHDREVGSLVGKHIAELEALQAAHDSELRQAKTRGDAWEEQYDAVNELAGKLQAECERLRKAAIKAVHALAHVSEAGKPALHMKRLTMHLAKQSQRNRK